MIYLPSAEAVAKEVCPHLKLTDQEALNIVQEVYAAIDRCTLQRVTVEEPANGQDPKA